MLMCLVLKASSSDIAALCTYAPSHVDVCDPTPNMIVEHNGIFFSCPQVRIYSPSVESRSENGNARSCAYALVPESVLFTLCAYNIFVSDPVRGRTDHARSRTVGNNA